jgi:hypothetical protein
MTFGRAISTPLLLQVLRQAVDSLFQDIEPRMTEDWVDAGSPPPPGCFVPGIIPNRCRPIVPWYRQWSSGMAFLGDSATSSSGVVLPVSHSPKNESSLKTVVQGPPSPSCHD